MFLSQKMFGKYKSQFHYIKYFQRLWGNVATENKGAQLNEEIEYLNKIIYNDVLSRIKKDKNIKTRNEPICLKYFTGKRDITENSIEKKILKEEIQDINFPYEVKKKYLKQTVLNTAISQVFSESITHFTPSDNENLVIRKKKVKKIKISEMENPKNWMTENNEDEDLGEDNVTDIKLGSSDPNIPSSSIPCGGCGAFLHCNSMSIPGFLPKEVFIKKNEKELQSEICQRCQFLKEFNIALGVNVSASEYPKIISEIKNKNALAILLIDLLDFPCSIWEGINKIIGSKPVVIVGNKVDLLIQDGPNFLNHIKHCLLTSIEDQGVELKNIINVSLISAKTGFGIENLITQLQKYWYSKGDVYLIGCTNVGKSSLFNALVQSDFCKVKAIDLMQKATVSTWPGTTLNLIKFPIMIPDRWKLYAREQRLFKEAKQKKSYHEIINKDRNIRLEQIPLSDFVGRTFKADAKVKPTNKINLYDLSGSLKKGGINYNHHDFASGKWCYDTPGVVNRNQIVNLLTTPELMLTVPTSMVFPRNFHLKPGHSLFIGGLARLDYVSGTNLVWFTVYASNELPITLTKLEDAEVVYNNFLGSNLFRVPFGGETRLSKWPKLCSKKLEISGFTDKEASADIVLSSAGWVSVTLPSAYRCNVEAWTPEGKGIFLRKPPIILYGHTFRGSRIPKTPAFKTIVKEINPYSFLENLNYNFS